MKKLLTLLLALSLLAAVPLPASARSDDPYDYDLQFTDVTDDDTFYPAVVWAVQQGVTEGTGNGKFSPELLCTRAQVVTFLWRAKGMPEPSSHLNPFADVPAGSYYETPVLWAVENGVTTGTSSTSFEPKTVCNWSQILTFLWRANGKPAPQWEGITEGWPQSWYKDAVAWADTTGILGVDREDFDPMRPCSRGTTVTWLYHDGVKTVSTVSQLAEAIAPGRILYLEPGTYNLTEWAEIAVMEARYPAGNYVQIHESPDGYEFQVHDVNLLRLRAAPDAEGKVELIAEPRYAQVMVFENCEILELVGLTLGHTEEGFCRGGVLRFSNCPSVYLEGMDLYGCGTYGLETHTVERLTVKDSVIHDCSLGIMQLFDTRYAQFDDCVFRDCRQNTMLTVDSTAAFFNNCAFRNNYWIPAGSFLACTINDQTIVQFSGCELTDLIRQELEQKQQLGYHVAGDWF